MRSTFSQGVSVARRVDSVSSRYGSDLPCGCASFVGEKLPRNPPVRHCSSARKGSAAARGGLLLSSDSLVLLTSPGVALGTVAYRFANE
jgi:hypothetical protein